MAITFDRVLILSDLHLPPNPRLGNFADATGRRLVEWTQELPAQGAARTALVLNGDIVDFLLVEDRALEIDLRNARRFAEDTLQHLSRRTTWIDAWRAALASFGTAGGQVVLLPGNHDPEWLHFDAATEFGKWLANTDTTPPWLTVVRDADVWNAQVGSWKTTVLHGHRYDSDNDIDRQRVLGALSRGDDSIALPPGSELVLGPLHYFKQAQDPLTGARRFPFLDALKPELPSVLLMLFALDPLLAISRLPAALLPVAKLMLRRVNRLLRSSVDDSVNVPGVRSILSAGASEDVASDELADLLARDFVGALSPDDLSAVDATVTQLEEYLTRDQMPYTRQLTALAPVNYVSRVFLRAWLKRERLTSNSDDFFSLTQRDSTDNQIIDAHLPAAASRQVVVAGHTHAARDIRLSNDRVYLNTGTWTNLLDLSRTGETNQEIDHLIDDLSNGVIPSFTRLTWAEITAVGPTLKVETT